ncbi:MAG: M14 family metallopeptidase [Streptosporangiaceae bacterium]|nr:M14 family metallopeptidase [Streptosporangiaceae bacterium]
MPSDPTPPAPVFPDSYRTARRLFRAAAHEAGATLDEIRNPRGPGPDDTELCADIAWAGPPGATRVLFCVSGTHGIEGYCGSAIQAGLLRSGFGASLPADTALLMLHALNPHGFASFRRVNEDNIDVNRNFVDHGHRPHNESYPELHNALVPDHWSGGARTAADRSLAEYAGRHGRRALQAAVTGGQWTHPDGLFYGGTGPCWSHQVLREVVRTRLIQASHVGYIDLHTGLGERGAGEPIFRGGRDPDAPGRARRWYGPALTISEEGTSSSTPIAGNTATAVADELAWLGPERLLTAITLEFGTLDGGQVLTALRADNWLHTRGFRAVPDGSAKSLADDIRAQMIAAFYPDDQTWRDSVWRRAVQVFYQARAGLRMAAA